MAIYYSRISLIRRADGCSAVAAAAYRCGVKLRDERTDRVHDYRRRRGVLAVHMLAPPGAEWARDVTTVWSRAEAAERRCNSRTGRELVLALPTELPQSDQIALAHRIAEDLVERYRIGVLLAVHAPDKGGDTRNTHVHFLMTTREVRAQGFGSKTRLLDDKATGPLEAARMRQRIADRINAALAASGVLQAVDPRPLIVQAQAAATRGDLDAVVRLTRTPSFHLGRAAVAAIRRGAFSAKATRNASIRRDNQRLEHFGRERAAQLKHAMVAQVRPVSSDQSAASRYIRALQEAVREHEQSVAGYIRGQHLAALEFDRLERLWRAGRLDLSRADQALQALQAWCEASAAERLNRERVAQAQHATVLAQRAVEAADEDKRSTSPPHGLSRRQWAEYRRGVRRALVDAEAHERQVVASVKPRVVDDARNAWVRAHAALLDTVEPKPADAPSRSARAAPARPDGGSELVKRASSRMSRI